MARRRGGSGHKLKGGRVMSALRLTAGMRPHARRPLLVAVGPGGTRRASCWSIVRVCVCADRFEVHPTRVYAVVAELHRPLLRVGRSGLLWQQLSSPQSDRGLLTGVQLEHQPVVHRERLVRGDQRHHGVRKPTHDLGIGGLRTRIPHVGLGISSRRRRERDIHEFGIRQLHTAGDSDGGSGGLRKSGSAADARS